jgi:hypothetical protein
MVIITTFISGRKYFTFSDKLKASQRRHSNVRDPDRAFFAAILKVA